MYTLIFSNLITYLTVSNEYDPRKISIWGETLPWELLDMFWLKTNQELPPKGFPLWIECRKNYKAKSTHLIMYNHATPPWELFFTVDRLKKKIHIWF